MSEGVCPLGGKAKSTHSRGAGPPFLEARADKIAGCIVTMGKTKKSKKSPGAGRSGHSQDTNPTLDSVMTAIPHRSKSDLTHFS